MMRAAPVPALAAAALLAATPARAQDALRRELRDSQLRLEQIRQERERLRQELARLESQVHDLASELANIERQRSASARALRELDFQAMALDSAVAATSRELATTRARLRQRTLLLHQRLRSIYKRGPLHSMEVLLTARSFGELLTRYKYLHRIAAYDRRLVEQVRRLEADLAHQEAELRADQEQLERLRAEKAEELERLRQLSLQRQRTLQRFRQREQQAEGRLRQLARDEARLTELIADLERRRLAAERRRTAAGAPTPEGALTTRDMGELAWPVEGTLLYRFGPERRPNGVTLRWNGIGIGAPAGTPVRAVEAGTVAMAGAFEGYGPTVMISHGGGYYTLYLYLGSIAVREGETVAAGQVIGTVGGQRTPEGPHIEFQVRVPVRGGTPEPVDPLDWLRRRAPQ